MHAIVGGPVTRTCGGDGSSSLGSFDGSQPMCEGMKEYAWWLCEIRLTVSLTSAFRCPHLPNPTNGRVASSTDSQAPFALNTTATYICNEGYVLSGSSTRTCNSSANNTNPEGNWSGSASTCEGKSSGEVYFESMNCMIQWHLLLQLSCALTWTLVQWWMWQTSPTAQEQLIADRLALWPLSPVTLGLVWSALSLAPALEMGPVPQGRLIWTPSPVTVSSPVSSLLFCIKQGLKSTFSHSWCIVMMNIHAESLLILQPSFVILLTI